MTNSENENNELEPVVETEPQDPQDTAAVAPPVDRVAQLEAQFLAERDRVLRLAADMDNLRKRSRKEVEEAVARGRAEVLLEILPVADSIDLALAPQPGTDASAAAVLEGVSMMRRQFLASVERFGVTPVEAVGKGFDPNVHEAVAQVHSDEHEIGRVVHEMRKGYVMGEKLLRPAMVVVSKGSAMSKAESESTPNQEPQSE